MHPVPCRALRWIRQRKYITQRPPNSMREFTLVDCATGLIYGPYRTCPMARAHAEVEAIATWEIFIDGDALVDWSCPDPIALPTSWYAGLV